MAVNPFGSYPSPGVYISESTYGKTPSALADHSTLYMLGFSNKVGAPSNELTFIVDGVDFNNVFGSSLSKPAVDLFFAQYPESGFYFINIKSRATRSLTATLGVVGDVYTVTIDGFPISYTHQTGDTVSSILTALGDLINSTARHLASFVNGSLRLVSAATPVIVTSNMVLGAVSPASAYPTAQDILDTAELVLIPELKQGFICAPEFYKSFAASERALLANSLDGFVARDAYKWVSLVDCGNEVATSTSGAGAVNLAKLERAQLASPAGHSWYYFPYWKDSLGVGVPMSTTVAAVAIKKYRTNFAMAPAGTTTPVLGVIGQTFQVTNLIQDQLNPLGINCGRVFNSASASSKRGSVIYGARTLSTSPFWRFGNTRVIANVLEGTLRGDAFDSEVFTNLDGEGEAFNRVTQTAVSICERMRTAGAFYGDATSAYQVICDERNNPATDLENARVNVDIYFKPSPIIEVLIVRCHRTAIGTEFNEALSQGNAGTATEGKPAETAKEGNNTSI